MASSRYARSRLGDQKTRPQFPLWFSGPDGRPKGVLLRFGESFTWSEGGEVVHIQWRLGDRLVEGVDIMPFDQRGLMED